VTQVNGQWRIASRPRVRASVTELIAVQMTGLAPPSAHALELMALGEPLPVAEMAALAAIEDRGWRSPPTAPAPRRSR